jgi:hypothetical protein
MTKTMSVMMKKMTIVMMRVKTNAKTMTRQEAERMKQMIVANSQKMSPNLRLKNVNCLPMTICYWTATKKQKNCASLSGNWRQRNWNVSWMQTNSHYCLPKTNVKSWRTDDSKDLMNYCHNRRSSKACCGRSYRLLDSNCRINAAHLGRKSQYPTGILALCRRMKTVHCFVAQNLVHWNLECYCAMMACYFAAKNLGYLKRECYCAKLVYYSVVPNLEYWNGGYCW